MEPDNTMEPDKNPKVPPTTISCLPAELLLHILTYLDSPAPSDHRLHDQPHVDMLRCPGDPRSQTLKNISCVSRRWRAVVLPLLFRHTVWSCDRLDLMRAQASQAAASCHPPSAAGGAIPPLSFLRETGLASRVESLTLVVTDARETSGPAAGDIGTYRRGDGSGHYGYSPEPLSPLPWGSPRPARGGSERDLVFNEDGNWLWDLVFGLVRPSRFTLVASPRMLASLLARMLFLGDEWSFGQNHHVLSLSIGDEPMETTDGVDSSRVESPGREDRNSLEDGNLLEGEGTGTSPPSSSSSFSSGSLLNRPRPTPCTLFTIRPWTSLLLNEGSSTRVYKTYEYFHKRPPSLLGALLGAGPSPNDSPLVPPTCRELRYVGIFPLSSHVGTLVALLPRVERLFVQLVPRNDILLDRGEMGHLDMDDLWAERNAAYGKIIAKMLDGSDAAGNWRHLGEFESGDAADRESWELAVGFVEARRDSTDWRVEREGVFVKRKDRNR